ncbi:MAG: TonB family protein [Tenuifilaceae bacterium]|jgi:TonB family protein|nr:TonB family protein [Tenuifilaceae bacterium]
MTSKSKGYIGSFVVHITILVLLILFGFSTPLPLPGEEGILINFGDNNFGAGQREPRPAPRETVQPVESTPERVEQTPITQDFEDAPSIPAPKPKPTPEKVEDTKPVEKPKEEPKPVEEKPREADRRALFPGQKTDGGTTGEGNTGTTGNQGDPGGSTDSQNRTSGLTSGGDGISFSMGRRAALSLPKPDYPSKQDGRVVVEITVNSEGKVIFARGGYKGSTTNDEKLVLAAEAAARKAQFEPNQNSTETQFGTITYEFKQQ